MGVMETKIIQVENDPYTINASNEAWGRWGWNVLNVQVTHSQNTKEYQNWAQRGSGEVTVETTTINYATITYQRDKGMSGYSRIAELEQEYAQVENRIIAQLNEKKEKLPKPVETGMGTIVGMLIFALLSISFVYSIINNLVEYKEIPSDWASCIIPIAVFLYLLLRLIKSKSPENKALLAQQKQLQNDASRMINAEQAKIVEEAAQILRSA